MRVNFLYIVANMATTKTVVIDGPLDLGWLAAAVLDFAGDVPVWCIDGEMAAGKTTFIKEVCQCMGVKDVVNSPTFSLVNEYMDEEGDPVYHFDFYRLNNLDEAYEAGLHELIESGYMCFIEWANALPELLPLPRIHIAIQVLGGTTRSFTITKLETADVNQAAFMPND